MSRWLVTGGAGYIGGHVVRSLLEAGHQPCVIDDLSTGIRGRIPPTVPFLNADIRDAGALMDAMEGCHGVIHLAGRKSVGESVEKPLAYWDANLGGTLDVLRAMVYCGIHRIVFSSTASVYANSDHPVTEADTLGPLSPYGASKLAAETAIRNVGKSNDIRYAILRYFNVAGCVKAELGDTSNDNLVPRVIRAMRAFDPPTIYGMDYPTRDGSAIRDYIHAGDLGDAHAAIATRIDSLRHGTYNLGTGRGTTVAEIIKSLQDASGVRMTPYVTGRRAGDPAQTIADVTRVREDTGWQARYTIRDIAESSWLAAISKG